MVYIALSLRGLRPRASVQYTPYNPSCPCYNFNIELSLSLERFTFSESSMWFDFFELGSTIRTRRTHKLCSWYIETCTCRRKQVVYCMAMHLILFYDHAVLSNSNHPINLHSWGRSLLYVLDPLSSMYRDMRSSVWLYGRTHAPNPSLLCLMRRGCIVGTIPHRLTGTGGPPLPWPSIPHHTLPSS